MSIKACELMVEAQKNPEKYEGKKYKIVDGIVHDYDGEELGKLFIFDGNLCKELDKRHCYAYISSSAELEEIKPEPKPVSFMEAAKSYKRFAYKNWSKFCTLNEVLEDLSEKPQTTINEMLSSCQWYIEE